MIKKPEDRKTKTFLSKYANTITKQMLEKDMYELKLSQRQIAEKYGVGKGSIQNLQYLYKMEILNMYERRVPRSLTHEQKQVILGTSIADGHIFRKSSNRHGALKIAHSINQTELLDFKYNILKEFVRTLPTIQISEIKGKVHKCKSFRTLTHDYFTYIHDKLYILNNKGKYEKHLNQEILDYIEPMGLAIAYMDDGTKHNNSRDFCFECFSYEEQQLFCRWLKNKFNLDASVIKYENYFRTRIIRTSVPSFIHIIEPFILSSMKYKL